MFLSLDTPSLPPTTEKKNDMHIISNFSWEDGKTGKKKKGLETWGGGGGGVSKEFYGRKGNFDKGNVDMSYRSLPKSPILEVLMGFNHFLIKNY